MLGRGNLLGNRTTTTSRQQLQAPILQLTVRVAASPSRAPAAWFSAAAEPVKQSCCQRTRSCVVVAAAAPTSPAAADGGKELATVPSTAEGKRISQTEVAAFIQRDDMMDQLHQWTCCEAGEGGVRNFGLPMQVRCWIHWRLCLLWSGVSIFGTAFHTEEWCESRAYLWILLKAGGVGQATVALVPDFAGSA
jgi:hypothetical protein